MDIESKHPYSRGVESDTTSSPSNPARRTILIVDPDVSNRHLLARILLGSGFECLEAGDVSAATLALADRLPEALVLDSELPGQSGLAYLTMLKQDRRTRDLPVVMMSAAATERDRIACLDLGADDFIAKPFSALECIARLQAVLRRCARHARWNDRDALERGATAVLEYGGLRLDPLTHRVSAGGGRYIRLSSTEFRLLRFFLLHPERVHTRSVLLEEIRGPNAAIDSRTVDAYIRRLRQALKRHGRDVFLRTVHGMGYQFSVRALRARAEHVDATNG
jgi:two-component system, OmpR family, phosphate regulon response regulator PhoB